MTNIRSIAVFGLIFSLIASVFTTYAPAKAASWVFPVIGPVSYSNDFLAARSSGPHYAIDIIAKKRQTIVAANEGTIIYVAYPQPSWGYMLRIKTPKGYTHDYIHMNNDTPGTDDGRGGGMYAFAAGVKVGNKVNKGQILGWVGDSGNAENTVSHLHFEVRDPSGKPFNPYSNLRAASRISSPLPRAVQSNEIAPYGMNKYGINIANGDVTGDSTRETVVGNATTMTAQIKVYSSSRVLLAQTALGNGNVGGTTDVAIGNVVGDSQPEIIAVNTSPSGSALYVYHFDSTISSLVLDRNFILDPAARSTPRAATADINGDGTEEIIVGPGKGEGVNVKVFSGDGTEIGNFDALDSTKYSQGIEVAGGDVTGGSEDEVIIGRLRDGVTTVRVFDGQTYGQLSSFRAYTATNTNGVRVSVANTSHSAKEEIVTIPRVGSPKIKLWNVNGALLYEKFQLEEWWKGSYDVGGVNIATGTNRRASLFYF